MSGLRRRREATQRGLSGALLAGVVVLAGGCGTSAPQTFHPGNGGNASPTDAATTPATQRSATGPGGLTVPPFGRNAHVVMTRWRPPRPADRSAVLAAKDFLLAVLYADYTGGRDSRWQQYVSSPSVRAGLTSSLAVPSVTTESFTGTVRFWRMHAVATKGRRRTVAVTECVDSARARNTDLKTGRVLPQRRQVPANQNYYSNTDVLARDAGGHWRVVSIPPDIYYPQAQECKP
jgi:hypothetical protein